MTDPVAIQIKFGQVVTYWDSPWLCGKIEHQDKVVATAVHITTRDKVTDCVADLDVLHWENIAGLVRSSAFPHRGQYD